MTNTAKKPAKTSRDTLDLDLDARLDQATSTLYLDEEPIEGDMLDQVLAKAKKELDAASTPKKPRKSKEKVEPATEPVAQEENIELGDGFNLDELVDLADLELENAIEEPVALQSESLKSLENQLASVLDETPAVSDDEIDELLGGAGYDFDSLLGDADDELTADEAQLNEDSLLAAVDELLNFSIEPQAVVEPEIVELVEEIKAVEPEIATIEDVETDISDLGFEFEEEGFLEPEVEAKEDLIESYENDENVIPFEEGMFEEQLSPEMELQVEPEVALDDLVDSVPFEDTLKVDVSEPDKDDILVEEFNDFDDVADIAAPLVEISLPNDDELAQQLDGLNDAMENTNEKPAGFDLIDDETVEKESAVSTEKVEDENDWLKQLDELDAQQSSEKISEPVSFDKEEVSPVVEENSTDWMKQLDDLDAIESPIEAAEQSSEEVAASDDWMSQLEEVSEENTTTDGEQEAVADDDWMSQLENLDDNETAPETASEESEEDWMKQLDSMDDSTQATAIDDDFNIADEPVRAAAPEIDEQAIIAKAAQFAIEQAKEESDSAISALTEKHDIAFSQLRADQDTLETRTRKQFADAESGRKKAATFSYAALGVGVIALLGSGGLGYMAYTAQNEAQTLKQSVGELENTVNDIVNKAPEKEKEIEQIKTSVEQISKKVDKLVADQQAATLPTASDVKTAEASKNGSAMNLLNSKATAPAVTTGKIETGLEMPKIADAPITPPVDIAPAHPAGEEVKADTKLADMAKKSTDDTKAKAEKLAAEKAAKAKADEAAKAEATLLSEKLAKAAAIAKAAAASTKTEEQRKLLAESSRYKGKTTRGMARGIEKERAESIKTASSKKAQDAKGTVEAKTKEILNTAVKPQKAVPAGKYSVNVVSYQQEWFAQSKAAEFKEKGIPVEVVPVDPNNHATKFRLKVGGFKTKAEADSYAAKVKKSHGIDTWTAAN